MKKILLLVLLLLFTINGYSQKKEERRPVCFADELMAKALQENPDLQGYFDEVDRKIANNNTKVNYKSAQSTQGTITIPVVIFIVHKGINSPSNISNDQVMSQIDVLNDYFEDNWGIKFCLATGNGFNNIPGGGIVRIQNSALSDHDVNSEMEALMNLANNYNYARFLRIWVVDSISNSGSSGTTLGYSMFPNTSQVFDGVVIRNDVFGNNFCSGCNFNLNPNYDKGKTLIHEIGHYLGLYHTFHEGCSGMTTTDCATAGDRVCDTPPVKDPNYDCLVLDSCYEQNNQPDDRHNFMDYGDDSCVNHLSEGQINRMLYFLHNDRSSLISDENLIYTKVCGYENLLATSFSINPSMGCSGHTITFDPLTTGGNITYHWEFGDPSSGLNNTSTLSNPTHVYNNEGFYTITLTISNGNETRIGTEQIFITECNPITGTEANWYLSNSNMLDFSSGVPVKVDNFPVNQTSPEAYAVQSDEFGNLLFYTNGVRVWDNNFQQINSNNLLLGNISTNGGVIITEDPANQNQYYIFTTDHAEGDDGLRYSLVSISGVQASMSNVINQPVNFPSGHITGNDGALLTSEGISAVQKCNGGYWILAALRKSEGYYLSVYSLDISGFSFIGQYNLPVSSSTNSTVGNFIEVSPDGNKIAYSAYLDAKIYIFDFNKYTGEISNNPLVIDARTFGTSFSPDSNLLYFSNLIKLMQYNVNSTTNNPNVVSSVVLQIRNIQRGPDDKIYLSSVNKDNLATIIYPNELSIEENTNACGYIINGPELKKESAFGLPNMIDARIGTAYNNTITASPINCLTYKFFANVCTDNFSWNFGDPASGVNNTSSLSSPTHTFSGQGNYTVTFTSGSTTITYELAVVPPVVEISGSDTACLEINNLSSNSVTLLSGQTVNWSITGGTGTINGLSNQSSFIVHWSNLPGIVSATVTDQNGCMTTVSKTIYEDCDFNIIEDCDGDILTLTSPATSSEIYRVSDKITTQNNYSVSNNYSADLFAMNVIEIKPNSHIQSGAEFLAKIELCFTIAEKSRQIHKDFNTETEVFLYPNPTKDYINIEVVNDAFKNIRLFSLDGKLLLENNLEEANNYLLDLNYHKTGVYILKIYTSNGKEIIRKIIKD